MAAPREDDEHPEDVPHIEPLRSRMLAQLLRSPAAQLKLLRGQDGGDRVELYKVLEAVNAELRARQHRGWVHWDTLIDKLEQWGMRVAAGCVRLPPGLDSKLVAEHGDSWGDLFVAVHQNSALKPSSALKRARAVAEELCSQVLRMRRPPPAPAAAAAEQQPETEAEPQPEPETGDGHGDSDDIDVTWTPQEIASIESANQYGNHLVPSATVELVDPSAELPAAGRGVVARVDFEVGDFITKFDADVVRDRPGSVKNLRRFKQRSQEHDARAAFYSTEFVDHTTGDTVYVIGRTQPAPGQGLGAFVNDFTGYAQGRPNAEYVVVHDDEAKSGGRLVMYVRATRRIPRGTEVLCDYGHEARLSMGISG